MKRKVLFSCCICNNASMNIYEIENGIEDRVLAGVNNEEPEWYEIKYDSEATENFNGDGTFRSYFMYGEIEYYLDEFMRL